MKTTRSWEDPIPENKRQKTASEQSDNPQQNYVPGGYQRTVPVFPFLPPFDPYGRPMYPPPPYPYYAPAPAQFAAKPAEEKEKDKKKEPAIYRPPTRAGGGMEWDDPTLHEWAKDDHRIFVGNLGNEVSDEGLRRAFIQYKSIYKAKVVRDKKTGKSRGYGFVGFSDPHDFVRALKEMQGKYICNRPCKLTKSRWKDRNLEK